MPAKQQKLFPPDPTSYGGTLLRTRQGRAGPRPLGTRTTMHLVLRASRARGTKSFRQPKHAATVQRLSRKFAQRYGVQILKLANVGNHLHFHIRLSSRHTYRPFIRALTAAIAMSVAGTSRWKRATEKFWDYRPFTRILEPGRRAFLRLRDYLEINDLEGDGMSRANAEVQVYVLDRREPRFGWG